MIALNGRGRRPKTVLRTQHEIDTSLALGLAGSLAVNAPMNAGALGPTPPGTGEGCDAFAWPVVEERNWFADQNLRRRPTGARLSRIDRAVELTLEPTQSVHFFLPPEKAPRQDSYSGDVAFFGVPHTGLYQVTISRDAAIDVFENGVRITPVASSEAKDCRGVRKTERFALAPGDLVLVQVSGALEPSIKVAFEEAHAERYEALCEFASWPSSTWSSWPTTSSPLERFPINPYRIRRP